MNPENFYVARINEYGDKVKALKKLEKRISLARLITFLSGIVLFALLLKISPVAAFISLLLFLTLFGWLVKIHNSTERNKELYSHLETINIRELQCLSGRYFNYAGGSEYDRRDHENSYDLDLFGHASLFQYINRTTSKPASDMLASWLISPAQKDEIELRQEACRELQNQTDWRQKLVSLGYINTQSAGNPAELLDWIQSENYFSNRKHLKILIYALSALAIVSTFLVLIYNLPFLILALIYSLNFLFYFSHSKNINRVHNRVGKTAEMLNSYAATIRLIEDNHFECRKLRALQGIFAGKTRVSDSILYLSKLVNRLDTRLNVMVAIPLNLFCFWDILCCFALEKWKNRHASAIAGWFNGMAEFEVLSSFANMAFNNPDWVMPFVVPEYFTLRAKRAGHPLIPANHRITNDIEISGTGKTVVITGSNMSGKSTFLRTIGVNSVLALAGAPVCAESFTVSHVRIFTSMRISDSLEDNTSSFYAELKRLKNIIDEAERNPRLLLLLDEILRGTNSNDRFTGSVALLKQLIGYRTVALIATHDLRLAGLGEELPANVDNYHFDVKIEGEDLYFDYKLTKGVCRSMNASILMKKMGIKI